MYRYGFISLLLTLLLSASDFDACQKVLIQSFKMIDGHHAVYTAKGWLAFSETPIHSPEVVKQSSVLGLYLFKEGTSPKAIKIYDRFPKEIALITPYSIRPNTVAKESVGIDHLASLKTPFNAPFALMGACCTLRGFNSANGIVTSDYINAFLSSKTGMLASAGVRFKQTKAGVFVADKNPFVMNNPLHIGDRVLSYNQKKVNLSELEKSLLFSNVGSVHHLTVERDRKKVELKVTLNRRLGGGVLADTFAEHLGFRFNEKLEAVDIIEGSIAHRLELLPGDKLVAIDGQAFVSDDQLRSYFSKALLPKEKFQFLIERNGLQFFVYIPSNIMWK